ncbi:MAG: tetratricopeptide repeat protein [Spirochaetaceae bacterium]|jgi:tetratricopeptide (TPR) repeat protein|nr:tetratricopeptide repeat protein [Spirochaetaceae bacterium]
MEKNEILATEDEDSLYSFFQKNRKFLFVSVIIIAVLLAGLVITLVLRDSIQKSTVAKLDVLVERYNGIKDSLVAGGGAAAGETVDGVENGDSVADGGETADNGIQALLDDLGAFGKSASGYPAARAWFMAANIYHERGEWQEARDAWLEAAGKGALTHLAPVCLYNAAVAAEAAGDTDSALSSYQKSAAFADFPAAAHAQFSVGRLEETRGDNEAAIAAYRAVIEKWPSDSGWTNLAHSRVVVLEAGGQ